MGRSFSCSVSAGVLLFLSFLATSPCVPFSRPSSSSPFIAIVFCDQHEVYSSLLSFFLVRRSSSASVALFVTSSCPCFVFCLACINVSLFFCCKFFLFVLMFTTNLNLCHMITVFSFVYFLLKIFVSSLLELNLLLAICSKSCR